MAEFLCFRVYCVVRVLLFAAVSRIAAAAVAAGRASPPEGERQGGGGIESAVRSSHLPTSRR
jgi:hypothetical protein